MLAERYAGQRTEEGQVVDWARAHCRDETSSMASLFFSEQLDDIARAKSICYTCPLQEACLAGAVARREPCGVWGGQLFVKGRMVATKRKRGRPPKNPATQRSA